MRMDTVIAITLICLFSAVTSSPTYNEGQSFFRHRDDAIERRSLRDPSGQQSMQNQWFKRYYHPKIPEFGNNPQPSSTFPYTSDDFLLFMKNVLNQKPHENNVANKYSIASLDQDTEPLRYAPTFREEDHADNIDYNDNYYGTTVVDPAQMEDHFQQALLDYLIQQRSPMTKHSVKEIETAQDGSQTKETPATEAPTQSSTHLISSTPSILSAPTKVTAAASSPTAETLPPNKLSVMPPVAIGKGQKEFPMLRPASENNRKFSNWAQNFENSMVENTLGNSEVPSAKQTYPVDFLTEELNNWKSQNLGISKKSRPMWY